MTAMSPSGDAGFTLMELLVALSLMAFLSLVLLASARFGITIWTRTAGAMIEASRLQFAEATISAELAHAYPQADSQADGQPIRFDGRSDSISFLTPASTLPGALKISTITVEGSEGKKALIEDARLELGDESTRHVLLHNVKSVVFSYYGVTRKNTTASWYPEWERQSRLPLLVRVALRYGHDAASSFTIATYDSAGEGCVLDLLTRDCRGR